MTGGPLSGCPTPQPRLVKSHITTQTTASPSAGIIEYTVWWRVSSYIIGYSPVEPTPRSDWVVGIQISRLVPCFMLHMTEVRVGGHDVFRRDKDPGIGMLGYVDLCRIESEYEARMKTGKDAPRCIVYM